MHRACSSTFEEALFRNGFLLADAAFEAAYRLDLDENRLHYSSGQEILGKMRSREVQRGNETLWKSNIVGPFFWKQICIRHH
jgi:hypothetical protein